MQGVRIAADVEPEFLQPDAVVLRRGEASRLIGGTLAHDLLALVDGSRTEEMLVEQLSPGYDKRAVASLIARFKTKGYFARGAADHSDRRAPVRPPSRIPAGEPYAAAPGLLVNGQLDAELWAAALRAIVPRSESVNLSTFIVVATDPVAEWLAGVNASFLQSGQTWLLLSPTAEGAIAGPHFRPGETACWACLAARLSLRYRESTVLAPDAAATWLPAIAAVWLKRPAHSPLTGGRLVRLAPPGRIVSRHLVLRRPQCPACGGGSSGAAPGSVAFTCTEPPFDLGQLTARVLDPVTGIVDQVEVIAASTEFRIFAAGASVAPERRRGNDLDGLNTGFGVGRSLEEAQLIALCESVERHCLRYDGQKLLRATRSELLEAVPANDVLLYSSKQLAALPSPQPQELDFVEAESLVDHSLRMVPACLCYRYLPHPFPGLPAARSCGVAAGVTRNQAILNAAFELIERDAIAIWWHNRIRHPAFPRDCLGSETVGDVEAYLRQFGRCLLLLDLTTDLGVPVAAAISTTVEPSLGSPLFGFGCHSNPERAAEKACLELCRFSPASLQTNKLPSTDQLPDFASPCHRERSRPAPCRADLEAGGLIDWLARLGIETILVDQTQGEFGLHVVRLLMPGLREPHHGFGPGRLFDVPEKLGWVSAGTTESSPNRTPLI